MDTTTDSKNLLAINKPKGYIVTRSDERGRKTVYDLLPDWAFEDGWMPIGRLDLESKGLLLFTQNGKIGNFLTKPGECVKIYEIWGPLFFGSIHAFNQKFDVVNDPDSIEIDFMESKVSDHSGIEALRGIVNKYEEAGKSVTLKHLSTDCKKLLIKRNIKFDEIIQSNIDDPRYHVVSDTAGIME